MGVVAVFTTAPCILELGFGSCCRVQAAGSEQQPRCCNLAVELLSLVAFENVHSCSSLVSRYVTKLAHLL